MIVTRIICDGCGKLGIEESGVGRRAAHLLRAELKKQDWVIAQPYAVDTCPGCRLPRGAKLRVPSGQYPDDMSMFYDDVFPSVPECSLRRVQLRSRTFLLLLLGTTMRVNGERKYWEMTDYGGMPRVGWEVVTKARLQGFPRAFPHVKLGNKWVRINRISAMRLQDSVDEVRIDQ